MNFKQLLTISVFAVAAVSSIAEDDKGISLSLAAFQEECSFLNLESTENIALEDSSLQARLGRLEKQMEPFLAVEAKLKDAQNKLAEFEKKQDDDDDSDGLWADSESEEASLEALVGLLARDVIDAIIVVALQKYFGFFAEGELLRQDLAVAEAEYGAIKEELEALREDYTHVMQQMAEEGYVLNPAPKPDGFKEQKDFMEVVWGLQEEAQDFSEKIFDALSDSITAFQGWFK